MAPLKHITQWRLTLQVDLRNCPGSWASRGSWEFPASPAHAGPSPRGIWSRWGNVWKEVRAKSWCPRRWLPFWIPCAMSFPSAH